MVAPGRNPNIYVPPVGADLVDVVEKMQCDDPVHPFHSSDSPASLSLTVSRALSSSQATVPFGVVVVPLARVQKLEA